jgi:folate-dependent phosphoribosylglycinamide formyltransferase PurN
MRNFVIISNSDPQYIFFKRKLEKNGFKNYFIINNKIKKKIFFNLKLSIKNQKFLSFLKYYLLKLFFFKKYTNLYLSKKKEFFDFFKKRNRNYFKTHNLSHVKKFKNKTLIVFGSPFLSQQSIRNFKKCYNVHMGDLPKYSGLKSFERMYLSEKYIGFSIHEINEKIDSGTIYLKKKIRINTKLSPFMNYVNLYLYTFKIIEKILKNKIKLKPQKKNYQNKYYGFQFTELEYKKFLKKFKD